MNSVEPYRVPMQPRLPMRVFRVYTRVERWVVRFFAAREPTLKHAILPFMLLAVVLYIRHPATNYIFDEQEALLANPYVNATVVERHGQKQAYGYWDAIHVDFWGLPPDASIGSYRPLPNFLWRATWQVTKHPFFHHLFNLVLHGLNGALLAAFAYAVSRRRAIGWLSGALFVCAAVITEAVSGIVGLADVLGGLGAILALNALRAPAAWMPAAVFVSVLIGLFSKESAMVCAALIPAAALLTAPALHPQRPARFVRTLLALLAAAGAFVLYVELRREWFPSPLPSELSVAVPEDASTLTRLHHEALVWFRQAPLPKDPLNNPLAGDDCDFPHRLAGALRVYWRGFTQVLLPLRMSGDYSFPQEPVPESLWEWENVAGGALMVLPLLGALLLLFLAWWRENRDKKRLVHDGALTDELSRLAQGRIRDPWVTAPIWPMLVQGERRPWHRTKMAAATICITTALSALVTEYVLLRGGSPSWVRTWPYSLAVLATGIGLAVDGWRGQRRPMTPAGPWPFRHAAPVLLALGMVWLVVSYFPHSNIPVVLPTVRAERFWYFPVIGTSLALAVIFAWLLDRFRGASLAYVSVAPLIVGVFLGVQAVQAYRHSMDYRDDLVFWKATKDMVPRSSKAHLNYSVMVGARGDLETRLVESERAQELAPEWAMAAIYTGDTLCRMHRAHEAWPHYAEGFGLGPNDRSLIALALQCMYDESILMHYEADLRRIGDEHPDSWIRYLAHDTLDNHEKNHGVDPQYRPRGYNEGPKDEEASEEASTEDTAQVLEPIDDTADAGSEPDEHPLDLDSAN